MHYLFKKNKLIRGSRFLNSEDLAFIWMPKSAKANINELFRKGEFNWLINYVKYLVPKKPKKKKSKLKHLLWLLLLLFFKLPKLKLPKFKRKFGWPKLNFNFNWNWNQFFDFSIFSEAVFKFWNALPSIPLIHIPKPKKKTLYKSALLMGIATAPIFINGTTYIQNQINDLYRNKSINFFYFPPDLKIKLNSFFPDWEQVISKEELKQAYDQNKFNEAFVLEKIREKEINKKRTEIYKKAQELLNQSNETLLEMALQLKDFIDKKIQELNNIDISFKDVSEYKYKDAKETQQQLYKVANSFVQALIKKSTQKLQEQTEIYIKELGEELKTDINWLQNTLDKFSQDIKNMNSRVNIDGLKITEDFLKLKELMGNINETNLASLRGELEKEINETQKQINSSEDLPTLLNRLQEANTNLNKVAHHAEEENLLKMEESITEAYETTSKNINQEIIKKTVGVNKGKYLSNIEKNSFLDSNQKDIFKKIINGDYTAEDIKDVQHGNALNELKRKALNQIEKISEAYNNSFYQWCNTGPWWFKSLRVATSFGTCIGGTAAAHIEAAKRGDKIDLESFIFMVDMILLLSTVATLGTSLSATPAIMAGTTALKIGAKKLFINGGRRLLSKVSMQGIKSGIIKGGQIAFKTTISKNKLIMGSVALGGFGSASLMTTKKPINVNAKEKEEIIYSI